MSEPLTADQIAIDAGFVKHDGIWRKQADIDFERVHGKPYRHENCGATWRMTTPAKFCPGCGISVVVPKEPPPKPEEVKFDLPPLDERFEWEDGAPTAIHYCNCYNYEYKQKIGEPFALNTTQIIVHRVEPRDGFATLYLKSHRAKLKEPSK